MARGFIAQPADYWQLAQTGLLITPNERYARELSWSLANNPPSGATAWMLPSVLSWQAYVATHYERCYRTGQVTRRLARAPTIATLARDITPSTLRPLSAQLLDAWTLCHRYRISREALSAQTDHRVVDWMDRFNEALAAHNLLASCQIEAALCKVPAVDECVHLLEFDHELPSQRVLLDAWRPALEVHRHQRATSPSTRVQRFAFASSEAEWRAAAEWARDCRLADPSCTVGVLVPNLENNYQQLTHVFGAVIDPAQGSFSNRFSISGGVRLGRSVLWQDVRGALELLDEPQPLARVRHLLCSPHLNFVSTHFKQTQPFVDLRDPSQQQPFRELMEAFARHNPSTLSEWVAHIVQLARLLWRVDSFASVRFQTSQAITRTLLQLASDEAEETASRVDLDGALELCQAALDAVVFAPERPPAPVQILGFLETVGLHFDHLWICGLDADQLPSHPNPQPLLPTALQAAHGVRRVDAEDELKFAGELFQRWLSSTRDCLLSHVDQQAGEARSASRFCLDFPQGEYVCNDADPNPPQATQAWADVIPPTHTQGLVAGGTQVLATSDACSFRGFARFRLGLAEATPVESFATPVRLGELAHQAMEALHTRFPTTVLLRAASEADIRYTVKAVLEAAEPALPQPFVVTETDRLTAHIAEWLQLPDLPDGEYQTEAETERRVGFVPYQLSIVLDRHDTPLSDTATGALIYDYKTGQPPKLPDVQLMTYVLSDPDARGAFFAALRAPPSLRGIAARPSASRRVIHVPDWSDQRRAWRMHVARLLWRHATGPISADSVDDDLCQRCEYRGLCRRDERGE